jgi:hypothetical protein
MVEDCQDVAPNCVLFRSRLSPDEVSPRGGLHRTIEMVRYGARGRSPDRCGRHSEMQLAQMAPAFRSAAVGNATGRMDQRIARVLEARIQGTSRGPPQRTRRTGNKCFQPSSRAPHLSTPLTRPRTSRSINAIGIRGSAACGSKILCTPEIQCVEYGAGPGRARRIRRRTRLGELLNYDERTA